MFAKILYQGSNRSSGPSIRLITNYQKIPKMGTMGFSSLTKNNNNYSGFLVKTMNPGTNFSTLCSKNNRLSANYYRNNYKKEQKRYFHGPLCGFGFFLLFFDGWQGIGITLMIVACFIDRPKK